MIAHISALIRRLQICRTEATEIIEFAVSLPLLVVVAVAGRRLPRGEAPEPRSERPG